MFIDDSKIPFDVKNLNQWVVWKSNKVPYNARNGQPAMSTAPTTWSTFDEAMKASAAYAGIGFSLIK